MVLVSTSLVVAAYVVLAVAAVTAVLSLGVVTQFVVANRRERLARHESIRSYYGHRHFVLAR